MEKLRRYDRQSTHIHAVDTTKWVCSCRAFLTSRWPMCYHLVHNSPDVLSSPDFFKTVIEERKGLSSRAGISEVEKDRLDKALKVLANSSSYGIYAEMNRQEADDKVSVTCHGIDRNPFTCRVPGHAAR